MRLVYYGTPAWAVPPLHALIDSGRAPALVVTRADRPRGRGLSLLPSPVRAAAASRGVPVATPARAGAPDEIERIRALGPDLILLVAYGQILSPELLRIPRLGAINVHFSLLPRHRGASPVQAAILAGDPETGVTTMWMTDRLDEGPVFLSIATPVAADEDAGTLGARLAELGGRALVETVGRIERGEIVRTEQDASRATYAPKLRPEDARLDLGMDPDSFSRRARAMAPEPGAYLPLRGTRLQILAAESGTGNEHAAPGDVLAVDRSRGIEVRLQRGSVWLVAVRPEGRKRMSGFEYANGARLRPGVRLPLEGASP